METLSERLKFRRAQLGMSQSQVARDVAKRRGRAFSQQAYAALESGAAKASAEIATIADVLGVDLAWLRDGAGHSPEPRPAPPGEGHVDEITINRPAALAALSVTFRRIDPTLDLVSARDLAEIVLRAIARAPVSGLTPDPVLHAAIGTDALVQEFLSVTRR